MVFALEISSAIVDAPQTQILERIVSEKHYATLSWTNGTSDERCKIEAIQTKVAMLIGRKNTFEMLPGAYAKLGDPKTLNSNGKSIQPCQCLSGTTFAIV
jgi:hypothetical protein